MGCVNQPIEHGVGEDGGIAVVRMPVLDRRRFAPQAKAYLKDLP